MRSCELRNTLSQTLGSFLGQARFHGCSADTASRRSLQSSSLPNPPHIQHFFLLLPPWRRGSGDEGGEQQKLGLPKSSRSPFCIKTLMTQPTTHSSADRQPASSRSHHWLTPCRDRGPIRPVPEPKSAVPLQLLRRNPGEGPYRGETGSACTGQLNFAGGGGREPLISTDESGEPLINTE